MSRISSRPYAKVSAINGGNRISIDFHRLCPTRELQANTMVNVAGCVSRDRRVVERKKPGRLKARKKPAWVKR